MQHLILKEIKALMPECVYNLFLTRDIVVIYTNETKEASSGYKQQRSRHCLCVFFFMP